uniref:Ig-like domain-containing protein n=1 Tax=Anas platyrhynchos TaxID=8839 RepID=A0A8B9QW88_ANAPL
SSYALMPAHIFFSGHPKSHQRSPPRLWSIRSTLSVLLCGMGNRARAWLCTPFQCWCPMGRVQGRVAPPLLPQPHAYPFVFQCKTGCELHPNGSYTKFYHLAYNAHSFLSFDVDSSHWKRWQENELAVHIEQEFNSFTDFSATLQLLLNSTCIDHMKRFIEYGRAALERREPPVATVFAHMRDPAQLLLVCRVTGFYPRPISVAWLRDGQEVSPGPGLNTSTILPNADLTYQLRSTLIVAPDDGHTYACRVRHCSLGTHSLLIPWGSDPEPSTGDSEPQLQQQLWPWPPMHLQPHSLFSPSGSSKGALGIGVAVVVLLTVGGGYRLPLPQPLQEHISTSEPGFGPWDPGMLTNTYGASTQLGRAKSPGVRLGSGIKVHLPSEMFQSESISMV